MPPNLKRNASAIRTALTRWYDRNRRDLPWRRTRDPYAIWISEVMLQQTRVAAVIPYYEKFLKAFPDARLLASAPEERVLSMWAGLGYYSRARNLQKSARKLAENDRFPRDYEFIRNLPGVGDYTAAAISSIAFGLPHAVVDGNVRRVIVRLVNEETADIQQHAALLLDRNDPGRWNQAMMELGATVCTPRDPHCGECPVAKFCEAHQSGTQCSLPVKRVRLLEERLERTLLLIGERGRILLTPSPRVRGFWDLPENVEGVQPGPIIGAFRHTITYRHYKFVVCKGLLSEGARIRTGKLVRWIAHQKLHEIALSTTAKKALRCLEK